MKVPPKIPNTKDWKKVVIDQFKFNYVQKSVDIPTNALWTTSCSKTKNNKKKGVPKEFYTGKYNLLFYKFMKEYELDYGVLSDKYGIHMFDEKLSYYDIHPTALDWKDKRKLGNKISKKLKKYGFKELIFYFPSPLLSKPYFEILWFSKLPVSYISSIKLLKI